MADNKSKGPTAEELKAAKAETLHEFFGGKEQDIIEGVKTTHGEGAVSEGFTKASDELASAQKDAKAWVNKNQTVKAEVDAVAEAKAEVNKFKETKDGKLVTKDLNEAQTKKFTEAEEKLKAANEKLTKTLTAEKAPKSVQKLLAAQAEVQKFDKVGWAAGIGSGKVKALGVGGALKSNLGFAEEVVDNKGTKSRRVGMGAVKWAGVGAGLYAAKDAVSRNSVVDAQTGEEMPRSMATRALELAAGVGVAGVSALGGKGRF